MASVTQPAAPCGAARKKMDELSVRAEGEKELKETNVSAGKPGCGRWGGGSSLEVSQSVSAGARAFFHELQNTHVYVAWRAAAECACQRR